MATDSNGKNAYRTSLLALWLLLVTSPALDSVLAAIMIGGLPQPWESLRRAWAFAAYWLGLGAVQLPLAFAVGLGLRYRQGDRHRKSPYICLGAVAVSGILVQVIKHLIGRPRPRMGLSSLDLLGPNLVSGLDSFPSGHVTTSFALAVLLAKLFPERQRLWFGLAVFVALGRVAGASHYLSDVVGGAVLGLLVGLPATLLLPSGRKG